MLSRRLKLEALEDRRLLATFTVSNLLDGPVTSAGQLPGSLRQAIFDANSSPGADEITFSGVSGTLVLNSRELEITEAVSIGGPGQNQLIIDANNDDGLPFNGYSIFFIDDGTLDLIDVQISGLTLTGVNRIGGGAIVNLENLTLTSSTLYGNIGLDGGGVFNRGTVTIIQSTLSDNSGDDGGGVFNEGTVTIIQSTLSGNSGSNGGGVFNSGTATITQSTLSGNSADSFLGGGVFNSGTVTITSSTLSDNSASVDGGGVYNRGTATITSSTLYGNSASGDGGGLFSAYGGGVFNWDTGIATIIQSTLSGNSAKFGSGVYNSGTATITQSTLSGNSGIGGGGGVYNRGTATITQSLISGNSTEIRRVGGTVILNGYNLIGNSSKTTAQSLSGVTAGATDFLATSDGTHPTPLAVILNTTLADNGGPTLTHALVAGSPAIDAGNPAFTPPPDFDQRGTGFSRIVNGRVDIGAFEVQSSAELPSADFDEDGDIDGRDFLEWQRGFGTSPAVKADGDADNDMEVDGDDLIVWQNQYGTSGLLALNDAEASAIDSFDSSRTPAETANPVVIQSAILPAGLTSLSSPASPLTQQFAEIQSHRRDDSALAPPRSSLRRPPEDITRAFSERDFTEFVFETLRARHRTSIADEATSRTVSKAYLALDQVYAESDLGDLIAEARLTRPLRRTKISG